MKSQPAVAFVCSSTNKYSFNALAGAIETADQLQGIKLVPLEWKSHLITDVKDLISNFRKVVLCVSFCSPELHKVQQLTAQLRSRYGNTLMLVAGGPHASGDPLRTIRIGFDVVVRSEGEETFPEFLCKLATDQDYNSVKGLVFFANTHEYRDTGRRDWVDLNKYPPFAFKQLKAGPIEITRGCPYGCFFCQTPRLFGRIPRHRSVEAICNAVQTLKARKLTDIRFITPNAFSYGSSDGKSVNISSLEELLKSVRKILGCDGRLFFGTFPSEVRPEHVTEQSLGLVKKYANNKNIIIGAQTGSQRLLEFCHRGHTVEDVYRAVALTTKAGLTPHVDFIFGLPGETLEDTKSTEKVISDLVKMGAKIHAHTFIPLPQTPFASVRVGALPKATRKLIADLTAKGVVYGSWAEQEKMRIWIHRYLASIEPGS